MEQWYALHTKFNAEQQVASLLDQKEVEVFLPQIRSFKASELEPCFPCYLFARVDLEATAYSQLTWIPGLRRFIAFDDEPVAIPDNIITLLQSKLSDNAPSMSRTIPGLKHGDAIEIIDGPFSGLQAIFDGPMTATERVNVLLNVLGSANRVQVSVSDIQKASPDSQKIEQTKRPRRTRGRGRKINKQK